MACISNKSRSANLAFHVVTTRGNTSSTWRLLSTLVLYRLLDSLNPIVELSVFHAALSFQLFVDFIMELHIVPLAICNALVEQEVRQHCLLARVSSSHPFTRLSVPSVELVPSDRPHTAR